MKSTFRLAALLAACLLFAPRALTAQDAKPEETKIAQVLRKHIDSGELPHAIDILYNNGKEEITCVGWADVDARRPVTIDDPYMQCSQTKGFCGVTIAMLVEEGKLSLDDPVSKYLPEFKTLWVLESDKDGVRTLRKAKNTLTVRMVMNHTGGFPFEIPAKQAAIPGGGWSGGMPLRSVAATAASQPLLFEPGTKVKYSNTGIDIGAAVVEVITGKKWEVFLQERVLDPLGMKETCFKPSDAQLARQIELYVVKPGTKAKRIPFNGMQQRPYNDDHVFPSAGAGLWTTARDQIKFYKMLMNLGVGDNGVRLLKEETVKTLLATSSRPAGLGEYSLGLNISKDGWFGHGGAWGTGCWVNPAKRQLKLWAVQLNGTPRPWDKERVQAENEFFAEQLDNASQDAYTGRTN